MQLKNKFKLVILSLLMLFSFSFLNNTVDIYARLEGSHTAPGDYTPGGGGGGGGTGGLADNLGYFRMKAIPCDSVQAGVGEGVYFMAGNSIGLYRNLYSGLFGAKGHIYDNWAYFACNNNTFDATIIINGKSWKVQIDGTNGDMAELASILNCSMSLSGLQTGLRSYQAVGTPNDRLAGLLGVTPGTKYIVVIEGLQGWVDRTYKDHRQYRLTTWHSIQNAPEYTQAVLGASDSHFNNLYDTEGKWISQASIMPYGFS